MLKRRTEYHSSPPRPYCLTTERQGISPCGPAAKAINIKLLIQSQRVKGRPFGGL